MAEGLAFGASPRMHSAAAFERRVEFPEAKGNGVQGCGGGNRYDAGLEPGIGSEAGAGGDVEHVYMARS